MLETLGRYYRTVRHLKPVQIRYRLWYAVRGLGSVAGPKVGKLRKPGEGGTSGTGVGGTQSAGQASAPATGETGAARQQGHRISLEKGLRPRKPMLSQSADGSLTFTFLNRPHSFRTAEKIDWTYDGYGALWTYNLNYHDFLRQPGMTAETGLSLIRAFIDGMHTNRTGMQPYPVSLRGINWIYFLVRHQIDAPRVEAALHAQYRLLSRSPEYHLLGNHLLENGCSLLFGAYWFRNREWLDQAREILTEQIEEQVLADGGHFERSTMYHAILLERLLDCCNLLSSNRGVFDGNRQANAGDRQASTGGPESAREPSAPSLEKQIKNACSRMLGWMEQVWMESGRMPLLNDAAKGIAPSREALRDYAARLNVPTNRQPLSESGYRSYRQPPLELVADAGAIGPDYIPGHAHSDTLSFVLDMGAEPVIVDPGVSTYENNDARQRERSTAFHNTVMVDRTEQSEVWSAFRVGRRAKIVRLEESGKKPREEPGPEAGEKAGPGPGARRAAGNTQNAQRPGRKLTAAHDGYKHLGITHERSWELQPGELTITDNLFWIQQKSSITGADGQPAPPAWAYLHFAPGLEPELADGQNQLRVTMPESGLTLTHTLTITFENASSVALEKYSCPDGYNQYLPAVKAVITFSNRLVTRISHFE